MNIFLVLEWIVWVSIISYGEIRLDIRVLWITNTFLERTMLADQGTTVKYEGYSELLTKQVMRKKVLYKKNVYILKLLLNVVTARIEAPVVLVNKFLSLWSSGQSSWLQIRRFGFYSRHYQKKNSGSGTGSTQPREYNWGATW
jgi:hypothetical protein